MSLRRASYPAMTMIRLADALGRGDPPRKRVDRAGLSSRDTRRHGARPIGRFGSDADHGPGHRVYDIGETSDLSVDASDRDNVRDLVVLFRSRPDAQGLVCHQVQARKAAAFVRLAMIRLMLRRVGKTR